MHLARTVENTCVVGMRKSAENAAQYKWAGPLMRGSVRIVRREDDSFRANNELHLAGRTVGVLRGSTYIARLERAGAKIALADSLSINVGKLLARRIDPLATSASIADENLPLAELFKIDAGDAYIACHPAVEDTIVARLNTALAEGRNSGALRQFGL